MGKFYYVGNNDHLDGTGAIRFNDGRPDLVLGGAPGELSDEEVARLSSTLQLKAAGAGEAELTGDDLEEAGRKAGHPKLGDKAWSDLSASEKRDALTAAREPDNAGTAPTPVGIPDRTTRAATAEGKE